MTNYARRLEPQPELIEIGFHHKPGSSATVCRLTLNVATELRDALNEALPLEAVLTPGAEWLGKTLPPTQNLAAAYGRARQTAKTQRYAIHPDFHELFDALEAWWQL